MASGGSLSARGSSQQLYLDFDVTGVVETVDDFRAVRRDINASLRDVMGRVGNAEALPLIQSRFPGARFARSLYVKRDRAGVFIGSRLRGNLNRALGWLDFGGRRPRDSVRRDGPHVIVRSLDQLRPRIDAAVERELLAEFDRRGFEVTYS